MQAKSVGDSFIELIGNSIRLVNIPSIEPKHKEDTDLLLDNCLIVKQKTDNIINKNINGLHCPRWRDKQNKFSVSFNLDH